MTGIVAHRGASGLRPENTLAAFAKALKTGVDGIELDVQLTADREVVVYHDLRLKPETTRSADGKWLTESGPPVGHLTLTQLREYDVGRLDPASRYARRYPRQIPADGERVPTLDEVIRLVKRAGGSETLWIELKTDPEQPDSSSGPAELADKVLKLLEREGFVERVIVISFDWRGLVRLRGLAPDLRLGFLSAERRWLDNIGRRRKGTSPWTAGLDIRDFAGSLPRMVKAAGGSFWSVYFKDLDRKALAEAHDLGLLVNVWTLRKPGDKPFFTRLGTDFITTDRPDWFRPATSFPDPQRLRHCRA